ncbi:Mobile element protein [hydrothermal vent metagenome]|uniref:Mobile element protein n=1 Tax=hydrothermal vent metagenome TaxID=652676 RepID=A0A3B0ZPF6_9ZZZZ
MEKIVRRSHDKGIGKKAIHMVSAWSSENGLVLGQVKTNDKSNEITAIPELLRILSLNDCIITIDAMGCQKSIAKQIVDDGGDYVFALKGNQGSLSEQVESFFEEANKSGFEDFNVDYYESKEVSRNRIEVRRHWILNVSETRIDVEPWSNLNVIGMVESQRTINKQTSVEYRCYIGSIENDAKLFGHTIRRHWGVENNLHWQLDMSFREDESRMRKGHSAENFVVMRHVALNLLKKDKSVKLGIKNKRLKAGWDESYLAKLLMAA